MKKTILYGMITLALTAGFVACNNSSDTTSSTTDTSATSTTTTQATSATTDHTATTTATSSNNYAALADTFRTNSAAGDYLDPRTGKALHIRVDTTTGMRYNESTNEPVWRYIDKRDYRVYSGSSDNNATWDTVGTARIENNRLEYMDSSNKWVNYDKRWKSADDEMQDKWKMKVSKDGDVKIKDANGKVKMDANGNVKSDSKMSSDSTH